MYIWPVLLIWDSVLPYNYEKAFQHWWQTSSDLIEKRFDVTVAAKVLQVGRNSPLIAEDLYNPRHSFSLNTEFRLDPVLNTSSREFQELLNEIKSLSQWLRIGSVAPTVIRIFSRGIDRPEQFGNIVWDLSRAIPQGQFFDFQVQTSGYRSDQLFSRQIVKKCRLQNVIKQPWFVPIDKDGEQLFRDFLQAVVGDISDELKNLGPRNSSNPGATPQVAPVSSTVVPVTTTEGPTRRAMDWNNKTTSQTNGSSDVRPTREVNLQKSDSSDSPATVASVDLSLAQTPSAEPTDQTGRAWSPTSEKMIEPSQTTPATITPTAEKLLPDVEEPTGPSEVKDEMSLYKKIKGKILPKGDAEESPKDSSVSDSVTSEGDSVEAELPTAFKTYEGDVVRRAKNGQLIVDTPSTINNREWWSPKWFKVPVVGPSRDLELEYGGVSTLRLMAASVRGTRHQFYGEPNQDAFAIGKNDKYVVIVVCDGVGSKAHSAYGSKYISFSVARSLAKSLETVVPGDLDVIRSCITTAVQKASDGVQTWSDGALFAPDLPSSEVPIHELSSTLMVGVIEIEASTPEGRMVVLANVGDSPCYTFVDESWTLRTAATKEGDVLDHQTPALPNEIGVPVILEWHDFVMNPREQLLLMTDGIGTSLASGQTPLGRWLGSRLSTPILAKDFLTAAQIEEWVDTATFDRQGEDDDRTLVVLYDFDHAFSEKPLTPESEIKSVEEVDSSTTETSDESKSELSVEETSNSVVAPPVVSPRND